MKFNPNRTVPYEVNYHNKDKFRVKIDHHDHLISNLNSHPSLGHSKQRQSTTIPTNLELSPNVIVAEPEPELEIESESEPVTPDYSSSVTTVGEFLINDKVTPFPMEFPDNHLKIEDSCILTIQPDSNLIDVIPSEKSTKLLIAHAPIPLTTTSSSTFFSRLYLRRTTVALTTLTLLYLLLNHSQSLLADW